ncbi:MAG: acetylxylan esterase [Verrucomicrobiales bacterium]|nr:acetylxylan esterase [Verrucomicrobiales bacterium]
MKEPFLSELLFPARIALALFLLPLFADAAPSLEISTDREDALYQENEEVTFTIRAKDGDRNINKGEISWSLSRDGFGTVGSGKQSIEGGKAVLAKGSLDRPGFLLLTATFAGSDKVKTTAYGGAGVSPLKIPLSLPVPDDFDSFWSDQKAKLAKVPMSFTAELQATGEADKALEAFDVKIPCEEDGPPVSGYFAQPKSATPKSLPAVLWVHGAGVRSSSLPNALKGARGGFLSLDINAHGIPNGKPKEFYSELSQGELKTYRHDGRESRDTIYFRGMLVRLVRAIDFLTSRPEWDGKVLAVMGHSQGGLQALAAGGLDDRVTFVGSGVPAGCDHSGMTVDRISGWPKLVPVENGVPDPAALEASRYIDAVNFATRCHADAIVSAGFIDRTCPPTSVYAAYNALQGRKEMINKPEMGHAAPAEIKQQFWEALEKHLAAKRGAALTSPVPALR